MFYVQGLHMHLEFIFLNWFVPLGLGPNTHGYSMSTVRVDTLSTDLVDKRTYSFCRQTYADDEPLPSRRTTCRFYFERSWIVFAQLLALAV